MHTKTIYSVILVLLIGTILVSCSSNENQAVQSIEAYIQALGNKDSNKLSTLSCSNWEQNALVELDSLTSVGTKVENLSCKEVGKDENNTYVACSGQLVLDYGGEKQQIDLSSHTYIATKEGGDWLMCGYKQ